MYDVVERPPQPPRRGAAVAPAPQECPELLRRPVGKLRDAVPGPRRPVAPRGLGVPLGGEAYGRGEGLQPPLELGDVDCAGGEVVPPVLQQEARELAEPLPGLRRQVADPFPEHLLPPPVALEVRGEVVRLHAAVDRQLCSGAPQACAVGDVSVVRAHDHDRGDHGGQQQCRGKAHGPRGLGCCSRHCLPVLAVLLVPALAVR
mmetsp:Transcript_51156/g.137706  ORF Transcript_51156/g.137706 Transcript_51156/m.137706 type:complete len:203 (+) Transcript_51156:1048-1656(+)